MADEFKQPSSAFAEFAGCDTSDLCLAVNAMAIVQADKIETVGPHMIREGFERLRKDMQPYRGVRPPARRHPRPLALLRLQLPRF